ncbi:hypothetical protein C5167_005718 [Papaver somniferum]|uniref:RNase H type-1 domain-containing protein n=1 Tax=Papaver somniferum TaxID=3469 RepID=A0A4Y7JFJ4_PAPSO|nr:uncharacterized protein LOC113275714 [Papaver somniferum]XP_026381043.1 uncharacterized protein LOC113275714 [Papaver somniferum]RZC58415.1 hypothetical protein C5167_005718 [Papaver somniferum]
MELLHFGMEFAEKYAGFFAPLVKSDQLISFGDGKLFLKDDLEIIISKKVQQYSSWTRNTNAISLDDNEAFLDRLLASGWCAVQLFFVYHYFSLLTIFHEKETSVKPMSKKEKKKKSKEKHRSAKNVPSPILTVHDIPNQEMDDDGMVRWIRPSNMLADGISRVDSDGAYNGKTAGYSCVIRHTKNGVKIEVLVAVAGGSAPESSTYHEFEGLRCGYRQAVRHNLQNVVVSCDCKTTIFEIEKGIARERQVGKNRSRSNKMKKMINDIIAMKARIKNVKMVHMYRGANEVANKLAKICKIPKQQIVYKQEDFDTDNKVELQPIRGILESDANGEKYYPHGRVP